MKKHQKKRKQDLTYDFKKLEKLENEQEFSEGLKIHYSMAGKITRARILIIEV